MISVLSLITIASALMLIAGIIVMVVSLKRAPVGYEDEKGFQFGNSVESSDLTQSQMAPAPIIRTGTDGRPLTTDSVSGIESMA